MDVMQHLESKEKIILIDKSKMEMADSTFAPSMLVSSLTTKYAVTTKKGHFLNNYKDKDFNYPIFVVLPIAGLLFFLLLIFLIILIRRKLRKRQLQRDLLPHYGYDHSEAEVFDGYTQFSDGFGSVERLTQENKRLKVTSPDNSTGKSVVSVEVPTILDADGKPAGTSTPKKFVDSLSV